MRKKATRYFVLSSLIDRGVEVYKPYETLSELVRHLRELAGRGTLRIVCYLTGEAIEFEHGRRFQ